MDPFRIAPIRLAQPYSFLDCFLSFSIPFSDLNPLLLLPPFVFFRSPFLPNFPTILA